ncbi:MAG: hypothetical protein KQH63_14705 [Desulfobulbaceae bacterium]|nr:hypothetical protein [Desulfobulbaceae bacterium]
MKTENETNCSCGCCSQDSKSNLIRKREVSMDNNAATQGGMTRAEFLKVVGLGMVGLSTIPGTKAFAAVEKNSNVKVIQGKKDRMVVDLGNREIRISADVTKDPSKPAVVDWGRRFQAFFGCYGGKMEKWFVFSTDVSRTDINNAIQELGITSRRHIPMSEVEQRKGLKATTTIEDYLTGDPVIVTVRFEKDGKIVETALEDLIEEKIMVDGAEVIKPYTPHWIYHGTAEEIAFPSGCCVCPSDCNGGIITDNVLPLKTTVNYYRVNWERMPAVGSKAEVVIRSIYSSTQHATI